MPEKNVAHTQLLDLQPLPVTALRNSAFEKLYTDSMVKFFNPIQTQVFSTLYNSSENVLLCAPAAAGKVVCSEFAILRMLNEDEETRGKCVYVAPLEAIAKERFADWSKKFKPLGVVVNELTGETAADNKILERSDLIITTPERWDLMSRRWMQKKSVQDVKLVIVDEMHLLDGEHGPTLEAVVEEKFTRNFWVNREMRKKFIVIRTHFGRIWSENGMKMQKQSAAKFSNFVFENRN